MATEENEDVLLRTVALQNAQSILLARRRAEEELVRAKKALELKSADLARSVAMMQATLESTTDGILVTDGDRRVTAFNQQYVGLWRLPPQALEARDHNQLIRLSAEQFDAPHRFVARIEEIYSTSPATSEDLLTLADGRAFERFSRVQLVDGQSAGRVWTFRDVTARRHAEEALKERLRLSALRAEIGGSLASTRELETVLQCCTELLVHYLGVAFARIWTLDEHAQVLELRASAGLYTHRNGPHSRVRVGEFKIGRIAEECRPHLTNDVSGDPWVSDPEWARREGMIAFAGYPLLVAGRCVGVMALFARHQLTEGVLTDLTPLADAIAQCVERRHAEDAVRRQSEWLRVTLRSIGDAVITTDTEARVTSLNPVAESLTGWLSSDAQGLPLDRVFQIINEHTREPVESPVARSLREGCIVGLANHTVLIARDGVERAIDDSAAPIRDGHGRVIGVVLIFRDFSERRRSEVALERAGQTSRFLADASAALAELMDPGSTLHRLAALSTPSFADWCIVDFQEPDGFMRRLTVTQGDPQGGQLVRELDRRFPPRSTDIHGPMNVLRTGVTEWAAQVADSVLTELARDDEHLSLLRELAPRSYICVPLASHAKVYGALTFITARSGRTYDPDDVRAAEDLGHRAAVAVENANLVTALREGDRRKNEFLAMLAHELRNPLAPVRNAVQVIRTKAPPVPELQWARDVIERQVGQMTRLIDDLLDVSRISQGKITLRKSRVALAVAIDHAVEASRPLVEKGGHELSVTVPPGSIVLEADEVRLVQVLQNLLNNAAKYTEPGGRIWLTAGFADGHATIRVKDTGVGLPADMLSRVFDMFTQVDRSLDRSQGGLGIGLTLVRRLVEMHGGTVEAFSAGPGEGSEFVVRLPATSEVPNAPLSQDVCVGDQQKAGPGRRVLVVDDNLDAADSLSMLLEMIGHEVRTANDGLEAVRLAVEFRPDLVVMDIGLPKLDGYEAAGRIRRGGSTATLVAMTGWGQEDDIRRSREAGFDHHLTKPVEFGTLQQLLTRLSTPAPSGAQT